MSQCEQHANVERRLELVENHERENVALLTELNVLVKILVESNEKQGRINEQQTIVLTKMSEHLEGLNNRLDNLEKRYEESEEKNKIDIRGIRYDGFKNVIRNVVFPGAALISVGLWVVQYIQNIK